MLSLIVGLCIFLAALVFQAFALGTRKVKAFEKAVLCGIAQVMVNGRTILIELVFSFMAFLISLFLTLDTLLLTNRRFGRSTRPSMNTKTGADNDDHKYGFTGSSTDAGSGPQHRRYPLLA